MRKIAIHALAAAVLIGLAAPAFADYWSGGRLYCTYGWHYEYDPYGNLFYVCN
jgi:hypothetical protein